MKRFAAILIGAFCLVAPSVFAAEKTPKVTIPYYGVDLNITGQWFGHPAEYKREWAWTKAAVCKDFKLQKTGKAPTQKTEVQVFYTAKALYLGITCYFDDPKKLDPGVPPEAGGKDADLAWMSDVVEIFVQPNPKSGIYYQFGLQPSGARFDGAFGKKRDPKWAARWRSAAKVYKDRWQAHIAIEFSSLVWPGEFSGTPALGDELLLTFCRSAGGYGEYSCWSSPTGWHKPDQWGKLVFGPRMPGTSFKNHPRNANGLLIKNVVPGKETQGTHEMRAYIVNPSKKPVELEVKLKISDQKRSTFDKPPVKETVQKINLKPGKKRTVKVTYEVLEGARPEKLLVFSVKRPDRGYPSYYAESRFQTFPLGKRLAEMKKLVKSIVAECGRADPTGNSPEAKKVHASMGAFAARLKQMSNSRAHPAEIVEKAKAIKKEIEAAELEYYNALRPRIFADGKEFVAAPAHPTFKVLTDVPFRGTFGGKAKLGLARNEYESKQFVLFATVKNPPEVSVEVAPLTGPNGAKIEPDQIEIHRVCTVKINVGGVAVKRKIWPDPMQRTNRTSLKPGTPQAMMLTVHAKENQPAGVYRGEAVFKSAGTARIKIPLEVEVFDFALPTQSTLHNEIWFDSSRSSYFYGRMTPKIFEKYIALVAKYRVSAFPNQQTVAPNVKLVRQGDGSLKFDFSNVDPYLKILRRYGVKRLNITYCCNARSWLGYFERGLWVYEPGKPQARYQRADDPWKWYERYLLAMTGRLKELGWKLEDLYYVGNDEPSPQAQKEMRRDYTLVKKILPGLKRTAAATFPAKTKINDLIDIWCPQVRQFKPEQYKGDNRELWMYTCTLKYPPLPCFATPTKAIATRITHWVCKKYGATGFVYWSMNKWAGPDNAAMAKVRVLGRDQKPWVDDEWPHSFWVGDGVLIYPAVDGPVPGLKLVAIRDGTEDYEYMVLLEKLAKRAKGAPKELVAEALKLSAVPDDMVKSITEWNEDLDKLEATRERIARLIVKLSPFAK